MIIDTIDNAEKYYAVHPYFKEAFGVLAALNEDSGTEKRIIDGDNAFVNYSKYINKNESECAFESHRRYIDIQFVVSGREYIDIAPAEKLEITDDRLDGGDIAFYKAADEFTRADLTPGTFVVLFPGEAHRPLVAPDGKGIATAKAVAKIVY